MEISRHSQSEKMHDYIRALQRERIKIQAFQRDLPLCLHLVNQAIESCEQQLSGTASEQSEGSEQTSSDVPVLNHHHHFKKPKIDRICVTDKNGKKPDWLRSVQLCNQAADAAPSKGKEIQDVSTKKVGVQRDGSGGAFHPFKREKNAGIVLPAPTGGGGTGKKMNEKERPSRKSRRCWSPQLHKRFLQALHQLGGSHVATPKQIRDLMKLNGLTNDEVKSHLQKYRLHTRRCTPSSQNISASTTHAPQFVLVTGGLWMPSKYTAAMATPVTSGEAGIALNGIYAPIASLPPPSQETSTSPTQRQRSDNKDVRGSHSRVTSSSTHTSSGSLAY